MILFAIVAVVAAYLIGSINFAVIFTKIFDKRDIRDFGSGNAGTTNVMRVSGVVPGILTFVFDASKGFAACILGKAIFGHIGLSLNAWWAVPLAGAYICGVACMIGHVFPLFFGFKGGKGVATSVGIFAVCCPVAIAVGLFVFALVTMISKYVSLGSLVATVVVIVLATVFRGDVSALVQILCCSVMALLIFYKHISNIKRLISGNENKIKQGR